MDSKCYTFMSQLSAKFEKTSSEKYQDYSLIIPIVEGFFIFTTRINCRHSQRVNFPLFQKLEIYITKRKFSNYYQLLMKLIVLIMRILHIDLNRNV